MSEPEASSNLLELRSENSQSRLSCAPSEKVSTSSHSFQSLMRSLLNTLEAKARPRGSSRYITLSKGPVVDMNGKVIGEHDGAASYTIGQRHGFRAQGIHYVVGIDIPNNTITVSENKSDALSASATLADVHWIGEAPASGTELSAQSRYHSTVARASLSHDGSTWQASFAQPELLSPGQSVVFYDGDVCLGGGVVENVA
jgi:tRNA-specific 2-thiouridylase